MTNPFLDRQSLDFGIPTQHEEEMVWFYEKELGLPLLDRFTIIEGNDEIFYGLHDSWLKLNPTTSTIDPAVTGYQELLFVADVDEPVSLRDPDGLAVTKVPAGHLGIEQIGVRMVVNDLEAQLHFFEEGMGAERVGEGLLVGNTLFFFEEAETPMEVTPIIRAGFTMLTLVVRDLASAHQHLIDCGGAHGLSPSNDPGVPGRCHYSFVRDPSGNWIELIQFAESCGPLPTLEQEPSMQQFLDFRDHGTPA